MTSYDAIGGYFELDTSKGGSFLHEGALLLNSGRSCFEYILRTSVVDKVYLPKYICDAMIEPLKRLNIAYSFYSINESMEIANEIKLTDTEMLVYVNYFGLKDDYCHKLSKQHKEKLVLDFSQAYYSRPMAKSHSFYSPRKFFGIPDGGILYTTNNTVLKLDKDDSSKRTRHLYERLENGANAGYLDFQNAENSLKDAPMKEMSDFTTKLLKGINTESAQEQRIRNFKYLHSRLKDTDKISLDFATIECPMTYPLFNKNEEVRKRLIGANIFSPTYWPNIFDWSKQGELEHEIASNTVHLPIDQRYNEKHMDVILKVLYED